MNEMRLIGMDDVKSMISEIVRNSHVYKKGKACLPHMIIMMDPGNGQTYTTEAITDVLVKYELREFHGLDEYLEYKPDSSKESLDRMFADIEDNAIYDNSYKGIVSVDVSSLASVVNQYQMKFFEKNIRRVGENATVVIYCSTKLGIKGEKLINRLKAALGNVKTIQSHTFTSKEYAEMIVQNVLDRGIEVTDKEDTIKVLSEVVYDQDVGCVKDAIRLAEQLVFYADYTGYIPLLRFDKKEDFKQRFCKEE